MESSRTTVAVQRYLDELGRLRGDAPAEPIVRELLGRSVERLHVLCSRLLHRNYPRLTRGPLNLHSDEMLSSVVERMLKAMREVRPQNVRQFFALVNQHMRWELNDLARRLDQEERAVEFRESRAEVPQPGRSTATADPRAHRILDAIEKLPDDEREVFNLVRIGGMTHAEAAEIVGVSPKTVQRRLHRCLTLLSERLGDLSPASTAQTASSGADVFER